MGCSSGKVTGKARIIKNLDDLSDLQTGEILITRFTDPNWTPALGKAKGVVTEIGGVLSHAAIIGRELGIPAILGLKCATQIIKTGDLIEIDGETGIVNQLKA